MGVLWADDPILDARERSHDQQELSPCCDAPLLGHWPCDERAKCSSCKTCLICESSPELREPSQEEAQAEMKRRRR